jgi:hypothetical protein
LPGPKGNLINKLPGLKLKQLDENCPAQNETLWKLPGLNWWNLMKIAWPKMKLHENCLAWSLWNLMKIARPKTKLDENCLA